MRFHLVSLPHTQTTRDYSNCAFVTLTRGFARMMESLGHEVILYSGEDNDAKVVEHVTCISKKEQEDFFNVKGPEDILKPPLDEEMWLPDRPWWSFWNKRVIAAIDERKQPKDFVCIIGGGVLFDPLVDYAHANGLMPVEYAVGYAGIHPRTFHAFGSSNWRHLVWGLHPNEGWRGAPFDRTIPHYFEPEEFEYREDKDDYFLYLGKLKEDKGVNVAAMAAERAGVPLVLAGQGPTPTVYGERRDGRVGPDERRELLAAARGVFVPSLYVEPFGMIAVEALLSGTPILTPDWGGLGEINIDRETGFVCNTLADYVKGVENIDTIDPAACWERGQEYTENVVRWQYDRWFNDLMTLWGEGWYA